MLKQLKKPSFWLIFGAMMLAIAALVLMLVGDGAIINVNSQYVSMQTIVGGIMSIFGGTGRVTIKTGGVSAEMNVDGTYIKAPNSSIGGIVAFALIITFLALLVILSLQALSKKKKKHGFFAYLTGLVGIASGILVFFGGRFFLASNEEFCTGYTSIGIGYGFIVAGILLLLAGLLAGLAGRYINARRK